MEASYQITLNTEIQFLKGVGPKRGKILKSNGISFVKDLIHTYPRKYLDRTNLKPINKIQINEKVVIVGRVYSFGLKHLKKGNFFQLTVSDGTGTINCIWFHGVSWIIEKFKEGDHIAVYGKIEFYKGYRIIHPEFDILGSNEDPINTGQIIPLYASNNILKRVNLDSRGFRRLIHRAFGYITSLSDHFEKEFLKKEGLMNLYKCILEVHSPSNNDTLKTAYYRLKFDEYFFFQLVLAMNKYKINNYKAKKFHELGDYAIKMYKSLNFELTNAQIKVMREIRKDLSITVFLLKAVAL